MKWWSDRSALVGVSSVLVLLGLTVTPVFAQEATPAENAAMAGEEAAAEEMPSEMAGTDTLAEDAGTAEMGDRDTLFAVADQDSVAIGVVETERSLLDQLADSGFVDLFNKGGNFMWPLLIASVLGLAVMIERFATLQRARTNVRALMSELLTNLREEGVDAASAVCERTRGPIAAILHAGLRRADHGSEAVEKAIQSAGTIEMSFLERGLIILSSVSNVAPLLGFLGTVSGMINAFDAIAAAEQVNAKLVASGISEALVTTATGLVIAIPALLAHNFFVAKIDRLVIEMEETSVDLIDTLTDLEREGRLNVGAS
jgi:biopolymer transport protein ExbB